MRVPKWNIYCDAVVSIIYVLMYVVFILIFAPQTYEYNLLDCIYYQGLAIIFTLMFYSFYRKYKHFSWDEILVFRIAYAISITTLINQTLDTFKIVHIGNIYLVILQFIIIFLSTILCKWYITSKR